MAISTQPIEGSDKQIYTNVVCNQVRISEDKLRLKLDKHIGKAKKSKDWLGFLGISITSFTPLVTADFHEHWGINAEGWKIIFECLTGLSCLCFVVFGITALCNLVSVDKIIEDIKTKE